MQKLFVFICYWLAQRIQESVKSRNLVVIGFYLKAVFSGNLERNPCGMDVLAHRFYDDA